MIKMRRKKVVLKKFAVPSIFPNCPTYFTDAVAKTQKLTLDDKEEKGMQNVYKKSRTEFQETEAKFRISSLSCIISELHMIELPNGWLFHRPDSSNILFLKIQFCDEVSTIERYIIVDESLFCKSFYKEKNKIQLSSSSINDIRLLENIIHEVDLFEISPSTNTNTSATSLIQHVENSIHSLGQAIDTLEHTDSKLYFEIAEASLRMRLTFCSIS
ncbi:hypothetical protein LOD99_9866 [Oopsacas minuta]|uniref:Uncharacterized protein n=1 Tax=Oopsacas minuta TaxID=111878 RepID=A0AAV7KKG1_9METZ|nr:hypothetical protein LOD99_9866 [Oopsacas minuta]